MIMKSSSKGDFQEDPISPEIAYAQLAEVRRGIAQVESEKSSSFPAIKPSPGYEIFSRTTPQLIRGGRWSKLIFALSFTQ